MDNRERILQCALELFYAKGYDAVGVQEIAQKAGITKPTLYYYFGSKYGLLETLLTKHFTVLNEELERASFYEGDVGATLYNIASAFLDYAMRNYKVYALLMAMFYSAKENEAYRAVKPLVKKFYSQIVHFFDAAEHELGNMNGRQEQFAVCTGAVLCQGLRCRWRTGDCSESGDYKTYVVLLFWQQIWSSGDFADETFYCSE